MKPDSESPDVTHVYRQEIEKESPVPLCGQRDEVSPARRGDRQIDVPEVGGFAAEPGPAVHNLAVNLSGRITYQRHSRIKDPLRIRRIAEQLVDLLIGLCSEICSDTHGLKLALGATQLGVDTGENLGELACCLLGL